MNPERKKILLLNPPGEKLYVRDYYCSKVSKANYLYHPADLLFQSGFFARRHDVRVIDAVALGLKPRGCIDEILRFRPDAVLFLTGSISWREDRAFLAELKRLLPGALLLGSGDVLLEKGAERLEKNPFIDAIALDFTTEDPFRFVEGDRSNVPTMVCRADGGIVDASFSRPRGAEFEIPVPRFELFPSGRYHFPFVRRRPFATVLTDYGCPFRCTFCVMASLGYKWRTVENVLLELDRLKEMNVRDVYFHDQTFGANRTRTAALLEKMIERNYGFDFVCWSRVDVAAAEMLSLLKRAGCHTIMMGVESGSDETLKNTNKGATVRDVRRTFELAKNNGLRTVATYIIGLPGESPGDCLNTIKLALELDTDFASFNIPVPRMSTGLRKTAIEKRWIGEDMDVMDQSGTFPAMGTGNLSSGEIMRWRRRAHRAFYGRPSYILRRLLRVGTLYELRSLVSMGMVVLFGK
ncbi:MAG: radical SAM protein [bacterium]